MFAWDLAPAFDENSAPLHYNIWETQAMDIVAAAYQEIQLDEGMAPVYKFENTATGTDFFTINEVEAQIVADMDQFESQGIGFYAHESEGSAVYRHFDTTTGIHSFESEIKNDYYEGIAYFSVDLFG